MDVKFDLHLSEKNTVTYQLDNNKQQLQQKKTEKEEKIDLLITNKQIETSRQNGHGLRIEKIFPKPRR